MHTNGLKKEEDDLLPETKENISLPQFKKQLDG